MQRIKQIKFILFLLFLSVQMVVAGEFTRVDWSHFLRSGVLPEVTQTYDLGRHVGNSYYAVALEYPELVPMTKQEVEKLSLLQLEPSDTVSYEWNIGVSRKCDVGQLSVVPVVKRDGKWMKLISFKWTIRSVTPQTGRFNVKASSVGVNRYAEHSVLSSGRWVKIRVEKEGVYQLTTSLLKKMGFSELSKVKVYGYGGRVENAVISYTGDDADTDDLEEVPLFRRDGSLLFYANGTLRWGDWTYSSREGRYIAEREINPYSKYAYYFVTEGENPKEMPTLEAVSGTGTVVTTFPEHVLLENDAYCWFTSGRHLFDSYNFANSNSKSYLISSPFADTSQKAALRIAMTASSSSRTSVTYTLNSSQLGTTSIGVVGQYDHAMASTLNYSTTIQSGENTLNIQTTAGNDARLDYILLNYDRQLRLSENALPFSHYLTGTQRMQLQGADASTQIWQIGQAGDPTSVVPSTLNGTTLDFAVANPKRRFVAVNTSATFAVPEIVGELENQDLHVDSVVDMVIIIPTSRKLLSEAERLADYHRQKHGLRVKVVAADDIYNEFSSGTPDAGAYRRYLKMLYDRAETEADMPRYLLLFGGSLWDNRMITKQTKGLNPDDYLLCYEAENSINEVSSYVTDDFFGFLDDNEGGNMVSEKIDIGIGRIPVTTAADAKIVVDKTIAYMENKATGTWKNSIYMMADDGDSNGHMEDAEIVAQDIEENNPAMVTKRVYWDAYTRVSTATGNTYPEITELIKNAMKKGTLVMNYSGHGAPYQISHEQVLKLTDFKEFSSAHIPIWVIASCELTPFDMPSENIGESSMVNKNGAAIAFYSASRAVYSDLNKNLNRLFMKYLLGKDENGVRYTLGDAARLAKVGLVTGIIASDNTSNKLKYLLMGDPALTLSMPTGIVVLDEINGKAVSHYSLPQLKAGSVVKLKGHVESPSGTRLPNFKGSVAISLFDSKDTITCKNNVGDTSSPYVFYERTKILSESSDSVLGGTFETSLPIPLDINYTNETGRLNFYAVDNEKTLEANGYNEQFKIGGSVVNTDSLNQGPAIFVYLNNPDFQDGGTVSDSPYFYAVLSDSDGINMTGNGVGHDLELIIDNDEQKTYILNNYYENDFGGYTRGSISFKIPSLEDGKHQLYFRAWDMKNNSSSTILNFVVKGGLAPQFDVSLTNNPAHQNTAFLISYDRPQEEVRFTVEVYDGFGRLCWKHAETTTTSDGYYRIPWDLTTNNGAPLSGGIYIYKVGLSTQGSGEVTKSNKIIVLRQ